MSDRTIHAFSPDVELVRYDRGGKWFLEPKDGTKRSRVTLEEAVSWSMWGWPDSGAYVYLDRPGGRAFAVAVRRARASVSNTTEQD